MIGDEPLISFVEQYLYSGTSKDSPSVTQAIQNYNKNIDYVEKCNKEMLRTADL
jgi:hypothetical protein